MEKISFFSADFRDGRIRIGNKTYPAGTFATHLLNQYYKDDTAARLAVYKQYSWHLYDTISAGYLDNNDVLHSGWEIQQILKTLPKLQPFTKLDVETERIRISELFTEDNADFIRKHFNAKAQILAMRINESALDLLPIEIDKVQQKTADNLLDDMMTTLTFYDHISNDMREAFEGLTEFCNRLDEAERFDEPHLLPIALDIFGNEKLDVTSEYVTLRKTAKSKTMVTARRMFFDNYYSFVLTDFFEGLHYGHYPRRCPICKRYFLMTSARRQVYCNGIAPYMLKGKTITCRKYAARMKEKELSEGNPINPIYKSRCSAIRVEQKRSTITAEFAAMALKIAKEYWQKAKYDDNYANGQFRTDMKRENLYRETDRRIKQTELNRATARNEMLTSLFAKTYEDNVSSKLSDEMYMELSHKYEVERLELKTKIFEYKERIAKISEMEQNKDDFLKAVRKFMEMDSLTAPMLRELIDHIDVYEKEGGKKNYTQRIVIYYRFVGYLELPTSDDENYKANTRKGVDVEYIPTAKSA